jgi:hypothetical protein
MTCHFLFLGASCTHQSVHHTTGAVTGYSEYIFRYFAPFYDINCNRLSYPARRFGAIAYALLSNFFDDVTPTPGVVVLELMVEDHSFGNLSDYSYYENLVKYIISHGALPVFFNLPHASINHPKRWGDKYEYVLRLAEEFDLIVIDVAPLPEDSPCRDLYFNGPNHTKFLGAQYYASQFVANLNLIKAKLKTFHESRLPLSARNDSSISSSLLQSGTSHFSESFLKVEMRSLSVRFDPINTKLPISFVFDFCLGPFSPVLSYSIKNVRGNVLSHDNISLWDKYCHYERNSFVEFAFDFPAGSSRLDLCISSTLPRYDSCVNSDFDFESFSSSTSERYFSIHSSPFFWVSKGCSLKNIHILFNA